MLGGLLLNIATFSTDRLDIVNTSWKCYLREGMYCTYTEILNNSSALRIQAVEVYRKD